MIKPEIGKYYSDSTSIIRVDGINKLGEPTGVHVWFNEQYCHASIDHHAQIVYMFHKGSGMKEITKDEFETKLKEYQAQSNELFNNLLNNDE